MKVDFGKKFSGGCKKMEEKRNLKISVIIPSYNRGYCIEQAISSVVHQTYKNIELIVIDGGSKDETIDILKKYDDRIAYWVSEPDKGIYNAANKGLAHVTGDYVIWLSTDDCWMNENIIEQAVAEIEDDTDILSCNIIGIDANSCLERLITNTHARDKQQYAGGMIPAEGMLIRSSLCRKYGYDESYRIAADYKFFLQCYYDRDVRFKFVDFPIMYFELSGISNTQIGYCKQEDNRIYRELGQLQFLDIHSRDTSPLPKKAVKIILKKLGLFDIVRTFYVRYILKTEWKHHCNNKICRWCGRK